MDWILRLQKEEERKRKQAEKSNSPKEKKPKETKEEKRIRKEKEELIHQERIKKIDAEIKRRREEQKNAKNNSPPPLRLEIPSVSPRTPRTPTPKKDIDWNNPLSVLTAKPYTPKAKTPKTPKLQLELPIPKEDKRKKTERTPQLKRPPKTPIPEEKTRKYLKSTNVEIPLVGQTSIAIPEFFATPYKSRKGETKYRLVNPLTKSRNLSTRRGENSIKLIRKPIEDAIIMSHQKEPILLSKFSQKDRDIINHYFKVVLDNQGKPVAEVPNTADFRNKERGRPEILQGNIDVMRERGQMPNTNVEVFIKANQDGFRNPNYSAPNTPNSPNTPDNYSEATTPRTPKQKRAYNRVKPKKYENDEQQKEALRLQKRESAKLIRDTKKYGLEKATQLRDEKREKDKAEGNDWVKGLVSAVDRQAREQKPKKLSKKEQQIANQIARGAFAGGAEGEGILDTLKNTANRVVKTATNTANKVVKFANAVVKGRDDYPPKVRTILSSYGDDIITSIVICRTPVPSILTGALGVVSGGEFTKNLSQAPFDTLYHLFIRMELDIGTILTLEKNEVINMDVSPPLPPNTTTQDVVNLPPQLTPNEILQNAQKIQGGKFFGYSARDNNCQDFILAIFNGSNIGNQEDRTFIKQDTKQLFGNNTTLRKISNTITDLGAKVNVLTTGAGLTDNIIAHFHKDNKEMIKLKKALDRHIHTEKKTGGGISESDSSDSEIETESDSDSDTEGGAGGGINFKKIKWGSFSHQFSLYKRKHKDIKSLEDFANYIIAHKNEFKPSTFKRAEFYKNIISPNNIMPKKGKGIDQFNNAVIHREMAGETPQGRGLFAGAGMYAGEGLYAGAEGRGLFAGAGMVVHHIHHHHSADGGSLKSIGNAFKKAFSPHNVSVAEHYGIPATTGAIGSALGGPLGGIAGSYAGAQIDKAIGVQNDTTFNTSGKGLRHKKGSAEAKEWGRRMREMREAKRK